MRARQKKAQTRRRRWRHLGLLALGATAMTAAVALPRAHRHAALAMPAAAPALPQPAVTATADLVAPPEAPAAEADPASAPSAAAACEEQFSRQQWRAAIDACTAAFDADSTPSAALRVAHAFYSHGDAARAGTWASKAMTLGSDDPDAWVLVGHAARQAGHPHTAVTAYHRYLRLAPHGWHAARVRAAVRELTEQLAAEEPGAPSP